MKTARLYLARKAFPERLKHAALEKHVQQQAGCVQTRYAGRHTSIAVFNGISWSPVEENQQRLPPKIMLTRNLDSGQKRPEGFILPKTPSTGQETGRGRGVLPGSFRSAAGQINPAAVVRGDSYRAMVIGR